MKCPKSITQPALTCSKLPMEMSEQMWEKYSSFTIKTPKDVTWCYSGVIIGDFEQINTGWDLITKIRRDWSKREDWADIEINFS